jgi:hypothetical protein
MVKLCQATIFGWLNHYCWLNLDQSCWTESCPIHVLRIACPFKSTLMVSHGTITTRRWTWRAKKLVKIDHRTIGGFEHGLALSAGLDNLFLHGGALICEDHQHTSWKFAMASQEELIFKSIGESFLCATCTSMVHQFFYQMAPIINYFA